LSTESQWLNYSQEIYDRSIHSVDLTVKSGKALRSEILQILTTAHNNRILKNNISEIMRLLKTSEDQQQYIIKGGLEKDGPKNTDRTRDIPHFARHDGFWFDFSIMIDLSSNPAEVIGFNFELRFPENLIQNHNQPHFIRFDFNPPGHSNEVRLHFHPGCDDFMIPSPPMNPIAILHLFLYGFEIPKKIRQ
jgi:hypothetical protein